MRKTPVRAGQKPCKGCVFVTDVVARNIADWRRLRNFNQGQLAERMGWQQHDWTQGVVSDVERGQRNVTVEELTGLALALGVRVTALLDPAGPAGDRGTNLDLGMVDGLAPETARAWLTGELRLQLSPLVRGSAFVVAEDADGETRLGTIKVKRSR